jgi:hypothetical protein
MIPGEIIPGDGFEKTPHRCGQSGRKRGKPAK